MVETWRWDAKAERMVRPASGGDVGDASADAKVEQPTAEPFGRVLREVRDSLRLSQSRLAETADFDHSFISRLESGARLPVRETVERIITQLNLDVVTADRLLLAGGFAPDSVVAIGREPEVRAVLEMLLDPDLPQSHRTLARATLRLLSEAGREAARNAKLLAA